MTRPSVELVTVEPGAIRAAEAVIAGCEQCRGDEADIPFDWVLADVLNLRGAYEFILTGPARCPRCGVTIAEKTLVEPQGGIEIESALIR